MKRWVRNGQTPVVFHLGDHDPSGKDMTHDITDRIEMFMGGIKLERLALNMDQVDQYNPPPNPAKITDSRATAYIAEFGGESASNNRTGRRGENVLSSTVDFRIQEAQSLFESSLLEEDKIAIAIERAYWGNEAKSFYIPGMTGGNLSTYVPNKIWETDFHYVSYSSAGSDVNSLVVSLGQRLGAGLISKESARETDPLISDPDMEHDRLIAEGVESALLVSIQEQAANPMGPYQPDDLAYLTRLVVEKDMTLYDAVSRTQQRAQDRQAAMVPAAAPEAQPGLAMPNMGGQSQAAPPQAGGLQGLLSQLGG
jgi:hypothetical protein